MPVYNFVNEQGDIETHTLKYAELEQFKKDNPQLTYTISTPSFGNRSIESGRLPDAFKDRMRLLKQKHPRSKAVDHLI